MFLPYLKSSSFNLISGCHLISNHCTVYLNETITIKWQNEGAKCQTCVIVLQLGDPVCIQGVSVRDAWLCVPLGVSPDGPVVRLF